MDISWALFIVLLIWFTPYLVGAIGLLANSAFTGKHFETGSDLGVAGRFEMTVYATGLASPYILLAWAYQKGMLSDC
jgi:hypothetical protein